MTRQRVVLNNLAGTHKSNKRSTILTSIREYKRLITRFVAGSRRVAWTINDILIMLDNCEEQAVVLLDDMLLTPGRTPKRGSHNARKDNVDREGKKDGRTTQ